MKINNTKSGDYKDSPVERTPLDWIKQNISDCFNVVTGTTPSTSCLTYWQNGDIDWITTDDLGKNNDCSYIENGERKITSLAVEKCSLRLIPEYSIIISTRAPVGYVAINRNIATINQGCKGLITKYKDKVSVEFFHYYLRYHKKELERLSAGSTFKELSKTSLESFSILYPPLPEQRKIAAILSTVDDVIAETDAIIIKTEQIKKGLMQDLFTKGIGHTEFKDTAVGRVPKEWDIVPLQNIAEVKGRIGWRGYTTADLRAYGPLTFGADNISMENNLNLTNLIHISQEKYDESPEISVKKNDILVVQRGSTIGKVAIVDKNVGEATINSSMILIKNIKINPWFLCYWLCGDFSQKVICNSIAQTGQPMISQGQVKKFLICVPPSKEQEQIASTILSIRKWIEQERQFRSHLELLKKGLMQDLLTGRVRVKPENGVNAYA
jgi:type I restriction enzyme, S subunit